MAELAAAEFPADLAAAIAAPVVQTPLESLPAPTLVTITVSDVDAGIQQFRDDLAAGVVEIEDLDQFDLDALANEARKNLQQTLISGEPSPEVVDRLNENLALVRLIEEGGTARLEVDGTVLLTADLSTAEGRKAYPILELVAVILDIVFVILALAGIASAFGGKAKAAAAAVAKSSWQRFKDVVNSFIGPIRSHLEALREASKAGRLAAALKQVAGPLCKAIFKAGYAIYKNVWKPLKHIIAVLFHGLLAKVKALFMLGAFICGLIATAGMAMLGAILNLIGTMVGLIDDTIKFIGALEQSQLRAHAT